MRGGQSCECQELSPPSFKLWVGPHSPLASFSLFSVPPWLSFRSPSVASGTSDGASLSEEELARILEQVEDKKKLIATMRNKPWPMTKKLTELR